MMKNFRKAILAVIFFLTILFNIERLDIGTENTIDINTFVYVISIISIFLVILSKRISDLPIYNGFILWFSIYFFIKFIIIKSNPVLEGEADLYLAITEISFLSISILIGYYTAKIFFDLESTVENITLIGTNNRVITFNEANEDIQLEIYRSRRFNTPLSIITIPISSDFDHLTINSIVKEMQDEILKHYSVIRLAKVFQNYSRRTDKILVNLGNDELVVLAPQTDKVQAKKLILNLQDATRSKLKMEFLYSIKTFPEDGQTFEKLYKAALVDFEKKY